LWPEPIAQNDARTAVVDRPLGRLWETDHPLDWEKSARAPRALLLTSVMHSLTARQGGVT
jgi:hypothetical protein